MPYPHQYNPILDEVMKISISDLKEIGYLKAGRIGEGVIRWTNKGDCAGSISIKVNMRILTIELDYLWKGEQKKYTIQLDAMPAQYGGRILHFVCPLTSRRCKKLFLSNGIFAHRYANGRAMYSAQIIPKEWRESIKNLQRDYMEDQLRERINKPRSKMHYQGKETKWLTRAKKILKNLS